MTRLTDNELEALLNDLESDRAERKEAWAGDAPEKDVRRFVLLPTTCQIIKSRACFLLAWMIEGDPKKYRSDRPVAVDVGRYKIKREYSSAANNDR